jgi:hypothetical protein
MADDWQAKAGVVNVQANGYSWTQTVEEVHVSVPLPAGTRAKQVLCVVTPDRLSIALQGQPPIVEGQLFAAVKAKDSVWTLEDGKLELVLPKAKKHEAWQAVLRGAAPADPLTQHEMEKKMLLEKFQRDHPGFDFSGADVSGNLPAVCSLPCILSATSPCWLVSLVFPICRTPPTLDV